MTLERLLESRDRRAAHQKELLEGHPGMSLVCVTVVMPGPVKRTAGTLRTGEAAMAALRAALPCRYEEVADRDTGFEGYLLVECPPEEAKRACCRIEDSHPLGRLMDLDVVVLDGSGFPRPVTREEVGSEGRRCLLCGRPARECMRSQAHSQADLLSKIDEILRLAEKS